MGRSHGRTICFLLVLVLIGGLACGASEDRAAGVDAEPAEIADHAGAVCGMLVRDQPAPRGQVLHRDGTRLFLCSLGDLLVHLSVPSRHGEARAVFVEGMDPGVDPMQSHTGVHPWLDAEKAHYVVGVPRRGIMGPPVLAYEDSGAAAQVAAASAGARVLDFGELREWWAKRP